jgi:hypothetical protein
MIRNVMKISKKRENALLDKISKLYFQLFFFSSCQKVISYKVSTVKKGKKMYFGFFNQILKNIFFENYLGTLKL